MKRHFPLLLLLAGTTVSWIGPDVRAETDVQSLKEVVPRAYLAVHDGWSSDEVLLRDDLNKQFISRCRQQLPDASTIELNWTLLNLRKAGKLKADVTKRRHDKHDAYRHLAEIAARTVQDKHKITTDRMMCDETTRREFDEQANLLTKETDAYAMRKAAFGLRKARQLKPELILRIADWDRIVSVHTADKIARETSVIPETPGIYIFRDDTGYLYVGESVNLRRRLEKHLDLSDRKSLAGYLKEAGIKEVSVEIHAFPKDSRAKRASVRRAYESALIASRQPRFNLRP